MRDSELILAAYNLVHQSGCALYDALYLALAQRLGAEFITADSRLFRMIGDVPNVIWIGDYAATKEE
ncbi:MAG: type II toxin-antitoxin system VapC family toxin [Chloroflexi bacterium]|nr:type II toxin-antitoxin system VapC family toxin [Chloroflexota bacterium]